MQNEPVNLITPLEGLPHEREGTALEKVSFSRGKKGILNGIDLQIGKGEWVGLIGPNGAGKSTLLKLLIRTLIPASGTILLDGKPLAQWSRKGLARRVAFLPQSPSLESPFTCREVVMMGRYARLGRFEPESAKDYQIAEGAMEETKTAHFADRPVTDLSGGERQRVLLARTLAQVAQEIGRPPEAKLLLLDEPTANLDPQHQLGILDLLTSVVEKGVGILATFHDLNLAARYCRRLILIYQGRVIADGTPQEVLTEQNLREVYGIEAEVALHPTLHYPVVTPLSIASPGR